MSTVRTVLRLQKVQWLVPQEQSLLKIWGRSWNTEHLRKYYRQLTSFFTFHHFHLQCFVFPFSQINRVSHKSIMHERAIYFPLSFPSIFIFLCIRFSNLEYLLSRSKAKYTIGVTHARQNHFKSQKRFSKFPTLQPLPTNVVVNYNFDTALKSFHLFNFTSELTKDGTTIVLNHLCGYLNPTLVFHN